MRLETLLKLKLLLLLVPTAREVKKLNKYVVLAIDWAASEYKYVKELQQELEEIGEGREPLKNLRKASKILRYVSRAERRTDRFEVRARKRIEDVSEELEKHLEVPFNLKDIVTALREIAKELEVEHAHLVRYSSVYGGLLEKELDKAAAEAALEEQIKQDNPKKAEQIRTALLQLVHQIEYQIKDAEKWISALDASLKKAQQVLKELPDEDKAHLLEEGLAILHEHGWPFPDGDEVTIFLAQHPADLHEMTGATVGTSVHRIFSYGLPSVEDLINEKTWPMVVKGFVKIAVVAGRNAQEIFQYSLPAVKELINERTWPKVVDGFVNMAVVIGVNADKFFRYSLPSVRDLINEETWLEIVKFVINNKDIIGQTLYSGQRLTFFKDMVGKSGIIRGKLRKTGSETIVLGGPLLGKAIIRIVTNEAFQSWKKAFEAEKVWRELGFDYVPIEPILKIGGKLRAFKTKEGLWRVSTKVLGPSLYDIKLSGKFGTYKEQLLLMQKKINEGLDKLRIKHEHPHEGNFCIEFHDGKIRLYAIDFDMAAQV